MTEPDLTNEGDLLGFVTSFGIEYKIFRKRVKGGNYEYVGICNGKKHYFYKKSHNDWRDEHMARISSDAISKLNALDELTGFKGDEAGLDIKEGKSGDVPVAVEEHMLTAAPVPVQEPAPTAATMPKKYIGDLDPKYAVAKLYQVVGSDNRFVLEENSYFKFLRRLSSPNGARWEEGYATAPMALAFEYEKTLQRAGLVNEIKLDFPEKNIKSVQPPPKREMYHGYKKAGIQTTSPAQRSSSPYKAIDNVRTSNSAQYARKDGGKPAGPAPTVIFDRKIADSIKRAAQKVNQDMKGGQNVPAAGASSSVTTAEPPTGPAIRTDPAKNIAPQTRPVNNEDPYLNNFLIYLPGVDNMEFVQAAISQLKDNKMTESFAERSREYERFANSAQYDDAIKTIELLMISEESKQEIIKKLEEERQDDSFRSNLLTVDVPSYLQNGKLTVVLPISNETDFKALEKELFEHTSSALDEIGKARRVKDADAVVLIVGGADLDNVAKYVKSMMDAPTWLVAEAGVNIRLDVHYEPRMAGKHRGVGKKAVKKLRGEGGEDTISMKLLNYYSDGNRFTLKEAAEYIGKPATNVSSVLCQGMKRGYFSRSEKGVYEVTQKGKSHVEGSGHESPEPKPARQKGRETNGDKLLTYAKDKDKISSQEIAEHMGISKVYASVILSTEKNKGYLENLEEGGYKITPKGISHLKESEHESPEPKPAGRRGGETFTVQLLKYAAENDSITPSSAANHIGKPATSVSSMLSQAMKKGYLERPETGKYKITPEGMAQI